MLEFTNEQIKKYLLGVVLFTVFYLLIYRKKGRVKNISGYVEAINS